jgi:hypothetical protein
LEELDMLEDNFGNGFQYWCYQRIKIQALLVIRRITTQANLEYPHWLYLNSLFDLADFYGGTNNTKLAINLHILIMEQLNGFDQKLLPRKAFDVFLRATCRLSNIFFQLLGEEPVPAVPAREELKYKNLLAIAEFITTLSKVFL